MARVQISVELGIVQDLFQWDDGLAKVVESVLNQVLGCRLRSSWGPSDTSAPTNAKAIATGLRAAYRSCTPSQSGALRR